MTNPFATSPFPTDVANPAVGVPNIQPPVAPVVTTEAVAPVATTEAVTVVETMTEATVEGETVKKVRKPRTKTNRRKTPEETKFILENYKDMMTSELASKLGLTNQQVYRTVMDAKKAYLEKAETLPPEKAAKIREWVEIHLPSKTENIGKGGKRGTIIDSMFDELFADIL